MSERDLYFAYGSNMSQERIRARIPRAAPIGRARVDDMRLMANKLGKDGSGKVNLIAAPGAQCWGVVFAIARHDWTTLDRFEWGYERTHREITLESGSLTRVQLYLAVAPSRSEIPMFDWYLEHMLVGAREHALPDEYVTALARAPVRRDPSR